MKIHLDGPGEILASKGQRCGWKVVPQEINERRDSFQPPFEKEGSLVVRSQLALEVSRCAPNLCG